MRYGIYLSTGYEVWNLWHNRPQSSYADIFISYQLNATILHNSNPLNHCHSAKRPKTTCLGDGRCLWGVGGSVPNFSQKSWIGVDSGFLWGIFAFKFVQNLERNRLAGATYVSISCRGPWMAIRFVSRWIAIVIGSAFIQGSKITQRTSWMRRESSLDCSIATGIPLGLCIHVGLHRSKLKELIPLIVSAHS